MIYLQIAGGLVLLFVGGELFVRGSVAIARRAGISPLFIGLTLVGFGTSLPELVTSVHAARIGSPGIALGNVIGSNIANILLVLGLGGLIYPMRVGSRTFRRDGSVVFLVTLIAIAIVLFGRLERPIGAVLLLLLVLYLGYAYWQDRGARGSVDRQEAARAPRTGFFLALLFAAGGLAAILTGAYLLVFGSVELARLAGISETVIGLTVVAVGTSLPELVTTVVAALRRHSDVAFGNVIGSNIFNVLGILGATAAVQPIPVPLELIRFDVWVMLAATIMLVIFSVTGWRLTRGEGAILLAVYVGYIGYLFGAAG